VAARPSDHGDWLHHFRISYGGRCYILNILKRVCDLAEFTTEGILVQRPAQLDAEGLAQFVQFAQWADQEKQAFEGREREWFAKVTAHVLRLAGTITFMEWGLTSAPVRADMIITASAVSAAIRLVREYFWPHARACLRQIGLTERHSDVRKALRWIRAQRKAEVSLMDIRRHALNERLDEEQTKAVLSDLERAGWVRKYEKPSGPAGGKPVVRWRVNPILFSKPGAETAETAET